MKKSISVIIVAAIVLVVNYFCLQGLSQAYIEAHRREFLQDYFRGNIADWIGLCGFDIVLVLFAIFVVLEPDFYGDVSGNWKAIVFFFFLPVSFLSLIYLF